MIEKLSTSNPSGSKQDFERSVEPREGPSNANFDQEPNTQILDFETSLKTVKTPGAARRKKVSFSQKEEFLRLGIQKYGNSWSKILSDPEFVFDPSRKTATLCRRAQTCKFF